MHDFLHLGLFGLILWVGFFDAVMDAIAIQRIHMGYSPLRDTWHLAKYMMRGGLVGIGIILPAAWEWDKWATAIVLSCGLVIGKFVWDATYSNPWRWFRMDETVKIRTGWRWLDKLLGIHW